MCREGNGNPLQYSCLENPMDWGAWWAAVHGVAKSRTRLSDFTFTFHFHASEKEMATHYSVLVWRIPGTAEPGGLLSMGSYRVGHDWSDLAAATVAVCVCINICLYRCMWSEVKWKSLSRFWLFVTPWTVTHQAPLSMLFSRQKYWSGLPFPSPGDSWTRYRTPLFCISGRFFAV